MKNEFVTYEQAAALRDLGFNETCLGCYIYEVETLTWELNYAIYNNDIRWVIAAPLKQQVFRWFREKYGFYVELGHGPRIDFYFTIYKNSISISEKNDYSTYEETENACIDKLITICKQQDDAKQDIS